MSDFVERSREVSEGREANIQAAGAILSPRCIKPLF